MKNKIFINMYGPMLFCMFATAALLSNCSDDAEMIGRPVLTEVRNYASSPNDTVIQTLQTDQWVVLMGENLSGVTVVLFSGVQASVNSTLCTDRSIVVKVPSIPFQSIPRDKINEITLVNKNGIAVVFNIGIVGAPIITRVRNYADAPNDTIINSILPDQTIELIGYNLKNATEISFQGVAAELNDIVYTDSSAIVHVPADLSGGNASLVNKISYTTAIGSGIFSIKIFGPPVITLVSKEIPNESDSVFLYGSNLSSVESLTFAGATITSYKESADGNSVGFVAPALTQSGPVVITTKGGQFTTAYNVNDLTTGIIGNMEWGDKFGYAWWGGANLTSGDPNSGWPPYNPDFTGNASMFLELKNNVLAAGAGDEGVALRLSGSQWMPVENLSDPVERWVLKFEVNVPHAWNGGTIVIRSSNGDYKALWAPWQISPGSAKPYVTSGWQTVVIPLSSFLSDNGSGTSVPNLSTLIGNSGNSELVMYVHNFSTAATPTSFDASFDNFRVIRQ